MTGERFRAAAAAVKPPDTSAEQAARDLHLRLTKPPGSLGRIEELGVRLAGMAGTCPPPDPAPAAVAVFAGDHGVLAEGVTPWPQEVTAQMVANFCAGGAAVNVLARQMGASVLVVDVGVATPLPPGLDGHPGLLRRTVRPGTANLAREAAMTTVDAQRALDVGVEVADLLVDGGAGCLITGEMGIGNSTAAAALTVAFTGRPAAEITGRGTGVDDRSLARKVSVVQRAVGRCAAVRHDPLAVLCEVGGLELAALAGFIVGGAARRRPVLVDGAIAAAALATAAALVPGVEAWCVAGHRSAEPSSSAVIDHLALDAVLDLGMRLGEGTGAVLALPVVRAAALVLREMATFDSAGVHDKDA